MKKPTKLDRDVGKAMGWVQRLMNPDEPEDDDMNFLAWHNKKFTGWFWSVDAYKPSSDWEQGGPIIQHYRISVSPAFAEELRDEKWIARVIGGSSIITEAGKTPLIAAMKAFVALREIRQRST